MCTTFGAIYSIPNKNKTSGREKAQGDKHWNAVTLTHPAHTHTQPTQRWNTISNHYTCTSDPLGSPAAYLRWSKIVVGFAKLKFHHSKADEKKGTKTSSLKAEVFSALDFPRGYYYDEKKRWNFNWDNDANFINIRLTFSDYSKRTTSISSLSKWEVCLFSCNSVEKNATLAPQTALQHTGRN